MKHPTNRSFVICSSLALALAIWFPVQAQSAEPAEGTNLTAPKKMECCQDMKEQKQKMMAEMKAQDAELTVQLAEMNSAPADKKLGLLAAIVTHMVEQRTAMNARMEKMHEEMMEHTMQHKQMGTESKTPCPMKKDLDKK
jgi:hypothetical protein